MKKILLIVFLTLLAVGFHLTSRPQYSILQSFGTNCSACHFNVQGGGVRTQGGWMSRNGISLLPGDFINSTLTGNTFFDGNLLLGMDSRLQWAKWPAPGQGSTVPVGTTEYNFMAMQLTPYILITPFEWLSLEAQYNVAYELYTDKRYVGQNPFMASAVIKLSNDIPQLRLGYFQPTMSMKWDDHTILGHQFYGGKGRAVVKPDDYAELGAQLDYEAISWLSLSAGAFSSNNLAQFQVKQLIDPSMANLPIQDSHFKTVNLVDSNTVSLSGRAMISPELGLGLTSYFGGGFLLNGDYYVSNLFMGIGMSDKWALLAEFTDHGKKDSRRAISWLGELTYQVSESVLPFIRAERQTTREVNLKDVYYVNQLVLGAHIYILPYFDLLPEYRIVDREHIDGYHSSIAFQIHIWY